MLNLIKRILNLILESLKWIWENLIIGKEDWLETPPREDKIPPPPSSSAFIEQPLEIGADVPPEYRKQKSVLTFRERIFFRALLEATDNRYHVFIKVRLADVIWLKNEPKDRKTHVNQILCKHLDFVLCRKYRQEPELAFELDDSSHSKYDHQLSDQFKDQALQMAGLPLVRIKVQDKYDVEELREILRKTIPSALE